MTRVTVSFAVALMLLTVSAKAEPCKTQGHTEAKELTFDVKNDETLRGMHYAFRFGLMPAEFPRSDIAAIATPCSRGTFPVGSGTLELFGEDEDVPPRWSKAPAADSPIIYVSSMPRPDPARAWADSQGRAGSDGSVNFKEGDMMFAVVLTGSNERRLIFAFFDKLPDDERLKALMQSISARKARWLVGFDVKTRGVTPNNE